MKYIPIISISLIFLMTSCGKKEETQNTPQQKDSNQMTQQQTTNNGQTQQQQQTNNQTSKDTTKKDIKKPDDKSADNKTDTKKSDTDKKTDKQTEKTTDSKQPSTTDPKVPPPATDIDFAQIFAKKCAKCHGKNGHGKPDGAPDLTSSDVRNKTDKKLFSIISTGVKAKNPDDDDMPSWKGKLTDDEINAAINYIRNLP